MIFSCRHPDRSPKGGAEGPCFYWLAAVGGEKVPRLRLAALGFARDDMFVEGAAP